MALESRSGCGEALWDKGWVNPGAGRGSRSWEGSLEFFPLLQISRTSHPKGITPCLLEGWGLGNQGESGTGRHQRMRLAPRYVLIPAPAGCYPGFLHLPMAPGAIQCQAATIPAAPDIPGFCLPWNAWTSIPKKAPGPGLPRGMSSIQLAHPAGLFSLECWDMLPFPEGWKAKSFPKAPDFHRELVPSSSSLDVGKRVGKTWSSHGSCCHQSINIPGNGISPGWTNLG